MMQTIISVIVFFIVLIAATVLWDSYNSSTDSNLSKYSQQVLDLAKYFEADRILVREWSPDETIQLVGVEGDGNSDVLVELAINAIEVPEHLRIIV